MSTSRTPIPVVIGSMIRIERQYIPDRVLEQLRLQSTFTFEDGAKQWCALKTTEEAVTIPRGLLSMVKRTLHAADLEPMVESRVTAVSRPHRAPPPKGITPRDYQLEIVEQLVTQVQGYVVLPCGGGKTTIGVLALLRTQQAGIVLVPTVDLMQQWASTVIRATGDSTIVRRIGGGQGDDLSPLRPGEIAVCVVKGLYDRIRDSVAEGTRFLRSAGVLLADEAHHLGAEQWSWLAERCPARWRWGLTATPDRSDGWGFILPVLLGAKLYEMRALDLIEQGYLFRPTVIPVRSKFRTEPQDYFWYIQCPTCGSSTRALWGPWQDGKAGCDGKLTSTGPRGGRVTKKCGALLDPSAKAKQDTLNWSGVLTRLSEDEGRQDLILELMQAAADMERRVLLLVGRKSVVPELVTEIRARGIVADGVSSGTSGRAERIAALRQGRVDVLVATQLADEGLDVPSLDTVIMANPGRDKGRAQQRVGRACRPEGLPPVIFDIVDESPEFLSQWRARRAAYQEAYGAKCIMVGNPVDVREAKKLLTQVGQ